MMEIIQEKNQFFRSTENDREDAPGKKPHPPLQAYQADVRSFQLVKVNHRGEDEYVSFDAVLCLDVLNLLPDLASIRDALRQIALHVDQGGIMILSMLNKDAIEAQYQHSNEGKESDFSHYSLSSQRQYERKISSFDLAFSATASLPKGTLHVTERTRLIPPKYDSYRAAIRQVGVEAELGLKGDSNVDSDLYFGNASARQLQSTAPKPEDFLTRRVTQWIGAAHHIHGSTKQTIFSDFSETVTEILPSSGMVEAMLFSVSQDPHYTSRSGEVEQDVEVHFDQMGLDPCDYIPSRDEQNQLEQSNSDSKHPWVLLALYGDLQGSSFQVKESPRRVYILRRV
jgi:hypothetical protein